jgi:hypothetical protein
MPSFTTKLSPPDRKEYMNESAYKNALKQYKEYEFHFDSYATYCYIYRKKASK